MLAIHPALHQVKVTAVVQAQAAVVMLLRIQQAEAVVGQEQQEPMLGQQQVELEASEQILVLLEPQLLMREVGVAGASLEAALKESTTLWKAATSSSVPYAPKVIFRGFSVGFAVFVGDGPGSGVGSAPSVHAASDSASVIAQARTPLRRTGRRGEVGRTSTEEP